MNECLDWKPTNGTVQPTRRSGKTEATSGQTIGRRAVRDMLPLKRGYAVQICVVFQFKSLPRLKPKYRKRVELNGNVICIELESIKMRSASFTRLMFASIGIACIRREVDLEVIDAN